jgi:DNA repair protein RecN (Recombination protein N)
MLAELAVRNLALIEDVRVELRPGFCAWTGETGAGKSLLLGALGLLLGERGSADLLRAGTDELRVTGRFELSEPGLQAEVETLLGTTLEESEVIVSRRLSRAGRSTAYVNDEPVAVGTLRQLGNVLVDVHGQRENQSLLEPAYQLELLDAFGNLGEQRRNYLGVADRVRELRRQLAELTAQRRQRQRDLELLRFEREELDKANLQAGELAELALQRERLKHAQAVQDFATAGSGLLYDEEGSIVEQVGKLQRQAETWRELDPKLGEVATRLDALAVEVQDVAETLRDAAQRWDADPVRQEEVEKRYQQLRRLETKYGRPVEDLVTYRATLDHQEEHLRQQEDDLTAVGAELTEAFTRLRAVGTELSKGRQKVAKKLAAEVQKQLADLGMPEARLETGLEQVPLGDDPATAEVPASGPDRMELMLAANKGEPARPLRKVASGGELARTMLGLKTVLAGHDRVATLVFDEIDANVGGRLGDVLGQKLAALGQSHQVICVTHLPQVASYARNQWTIEKTRRGSRTTTTIRMLQETERLEELASMLRGEARGETTRKEAEAMLEAARKRW